MKLVVVALIFLGLSASVAARNPVSGREMEQRVPHEEATASTPRPLTDDAKPRADQPAPTDLHGEPLPPGAVARLGTLRDNIGFISSDIVVSPDAKAVTATSGFIGIPLRLWDVASGRIMRELKELDLGGRGPVWVAVVAFSPDGKLLAAGDTVGTVRIGNTGTGRKLVEIPGPETVRGLTFLPDGKTLAVSYYDGTDWLYKIPTGERIRSPRCRGMIFTAGGSVLAAQRYDGTVIFQDLVTRRDRTLFPRGRLWPHAFFSRDGRLLGIHGGIYPRALSPDGSVLALQGHDNTLRLWEVPTGREIYRFTTYRMPEGLIDETWVDHILFSPDGKLLAVGDTTSSLCLWSVASGRPFRRFPNLVDGHGIAFTPDGKWLISGGKYFRYWDIKRGREVTRFPQPGEVEAVVFGPDSKTVVTADGKVVRLWDASTGKEVREFKGHRGVVHAVSITSDGKTIASADDDATLIIWDLRTGRVVRRVAGLGDPAKARRKGWFPQVAFAPDGKTLAASEDGALRLWETETGQEIRRIRGLRGTVQSLRFAPDGKTLAGTDDGGVLLWDVAMGREESSSPHREGTVLAFAPAGGILAAGKNGEVTLWDTETGRWMSNVRIEQNSDPDLYSIHSIAFSPDGKTFATASGDGVRLWDTATGKLGRHLKGHLGMVTEIAIAPDGKTLASAGEDGTVLIWSMTTTGRN